MIISAHELREVTNYLIDKLITEDVELMADFYWDVQFEPRYNPYVEPTGDLGLGQLSFDWERIRTIYTERRDLVPMALLWLGNIIRAAGELPPIQERGFDWDRQGDEQFVQLVTLYGGGTDELRPRDVSGMGIYAQVSIGVLDVAISQCDYSGGSLLTVTAGLGVGTSVSGGMTSTEVRR